jgi:PadR family transcriptional regulator, regulatory protein PadR
MECCDMKGYLSYLVLWIVKKKPSNGAEISAELEKRRGSKPSPGTIYPVLKDLKEKGFIASDKNKVYSLTIKGDKELKGACNVFCRMFYDIKEMALCHHEKIKKRHKQFFQNK